MLRALLAVCLVSLPALAIAAPAKEPVKTQTAKPVAATTPEIEAVSVFGSACVATKGELEDVEKHFDALVKAKGAIKLSEAEAKKATGHETDDAWVMQSPVSKQKLLVSKDDDDSCNVFVHRADMKAMRSEFQGIAQWAAAQNKTVVAKQSETKIEGGVPLTMDYYEVLTQDKSKRPMLTLTSTDKPKSDTQFLLTYKTVKSKIDAPKIEEKKK